MFYSAEDGAVNPVRLRRENPGRYYQPTKRLKTRDRISTKLEAAVDATLEELEDDSEDDLEDDLEEDPKEDSEDDLEDTSSRPQFYLPESVARQVNMSAIDPINPAQLSRAAKTVESFQKREMDMLRLFDADKEDDADAFFKKLKASAGLQDDAQRAAPTAEHKSMTSAISDAPMIHSQRYQAVRSSGRTINPAQFAKMERSALVQQIQSEAEYILAREHSVFTEEQLRDGLDRSVILHEFYEICQIPDAAHIAMFADVLGTDEDTIENWFEDKRRRTRGIFITKSLLEAPGFRTRQLYRENKLATIMKFGSFAQPPPQ